MSKIYDALTKADRTPQADATNGIHFPKENLLDADNGQSGEFFQESKEVAQPSAPPASDRQNLLVESNGLPNKINDEFQVLAIRARNLLKEGDKRVLLVTSALADEGKSFVVSKLGVAIAKPGQHVVLVDSDLRTPSLHRPFGVSPLNGLTSYLLEKATLEECVYPTNTPGLSLIPAGGTSNSASELFSGPRMTRFLKALRDRDPDAIIVIDSPPVLAASETRIMAGLVDAIIMVVAANQTSRSSVERAIAQLQLMPLAGLVLNKFEPTLSDRHEYGYEYGEQQKGASLY